MSETHSYSLRLPYGEHRIACVVRPSFGRSRKSIAIHVEPDGRVLVDAPSAAPVSAVRAAIVRRLGWIYRQRTEAQRRLDLVTPREYVSGETLHYLGRRYRLKLVRDGAFEQVRLSGGYIEVPAARWVPSARIRELLEEWYRRRANVVLRERVEAVARKLRWIEQPPAVIVRAMRRQWGSCSPSGKITLNTMLVRASRESIDYVILHELCHLREHNHGPKFFRLLRTHMPGWQRVKTRLDDGAAAILSG